MPSTVPSAVDPPVVAGRAARRQATSVQNTLDEASLIAATVIESAECEVVEGEYSSSESPSESSAMQHGQHGKYGQSVAEVRGGRYWAWRLCWSWPGNILAAAWNYTSLIVWLAVLAVVPVVQLASLGYLLRAAANLAQGGAWSSAFPGCRLAGRLATFALWSGLLWLPVLLVTDLSYSVQLLRPGSTQAAAWRIAAFMIAGAWLVWVAWGAVRGGRWWHMLWPAPIRFLKQAWRPATWSTAADQLWFLFERSRFFQLWWLGARAAVGALLWLSIPASLMIIGLRAQRLEAAALVGLIGAVSLTVVMMYLPYLQILMAERNRFREIFNVRQVRQRFVRAPLAMACALTVLLALSLPLYLLRIEATPEQLTWLPSLFFVGLMFPAKILLGAAMGYAQRRSRPRNFVLRWSARVVCLVASLAYVGALYIAQFVAWQGIYVMYFQHAVLVPVAN